MNVKFKKLSKDAVVPTKAHPTDAGFDMTAVSVNETEYYIEYDTGIAVEIPENHVGLLCPRSSISKYDLFLSNSIGIIDSGFRSSIKFRFKKVISNNNLKLRGFYKSNFFTRLFGLTDVLTEADLCYSYNKYNVGDRIGQLIIIPYPEITFTEVDTLSESDRGEGGFGSTDTVKKPKKSRTKRENAL